MSDQDRPRYTRGERLTSWRGRHGVQLRSLRRKAWPRRATLPKNLNTRARHRAVKLRIA